MSKSVSLSSLAVRFYESQGWIKEEILKYMVRPGFDGDLEYKLCSYASYWIPQVGTQMDFDKMIADGITVDGKELWGETRGLSDLDALKRRAW